MRILDAFAARLGYQKRARSNISSDAYLTEFFGLRGTAAGYVTPDAALSNLAVAARCVSLRSELLASVGLHLYRRTADGGRERATDLPLYSVLHDLANESMSAFEAREFLVRSLDMHGNAFARIERDSAGRVVALYPLAFADVSVERLPSGRLRYKAQGAVLLADEVLHIRGPSRDGVMGLSPLQIAAGAVGFALTQQETATGLVMNGLQSSGLISVDSKLDEAAFKRFTAWMGRHFAGPGNAGKPLILDNGAKYSPFTFSPADSEFLASRKLSNLDLCRIYGVPPTAAGITDNATYSNVEGESAALVSRALAPLASRVEAAMARCLLTSTGRESLFIEHDFNSILRGDVQARANAYRVLAECGAMSPNDIRQRENMPPVADGDQFFRPANWMALSDRAPVSSPPPAP